MTLPGVDLGWSLSSLISHHTVEDRGEGPSTCTCILRIPASKDWLHLHRAHILLGRKVMEWLWLKDFLRNKDQPSQIQFPASYIKLPLAILHMVMYMFEWNHPTSPSPTVSKSLFSMFVSPLLPCTYYLSRVHIYALIHSICLSLSDLLPSV